MKSKLIINWELSLICNLDCSFCSQKERRSKSSSILKLENIYNIIDNLPKNSHLSFLWWETFLFPNILDIFNKLENSEITYEITTNWILLDKYLDKLNNLKNLSQINISIDWYWEFHDNSRWKKWLFISLKKVIPKLNEIKKVSVSTVISSELENTNLIKLHLWLDSIWILEHKLIYMMNFSKNDVNDSKKIINSLQVWLPWKENNNNSELIKDYLEKLSIIRKLKTNTKIIVEPLALFKKWSLSCKQLDKQLRINENWKLSICEFITNNFNDLSKIKIEEAIKNDDYLKLKRSILNNFPLNICKYCCKLYNK